MPNTAIQINYLYSNSLDTINWSYFLYIRCEISLDETKENQIVKPISWSLHLYILHS